MRRSTAAAAMPRAVTTGTRTPRTAGAGSARSRYNWNQNATNRGKDWYFESLPHSSPEPGGEVDAFISKTKAGGAEPLVTVPMMGWVARLGLLRSRLASYSILKYGLQLDRDLQWFLDAGNGIRLDGQYVVNDPNDANMPSTPSFQRGWVLHLLQRWGQP